MDIYEQLTRDEGRKKFPYEDTVGKLTIGVGRNLTDVGLSDAEIDLLLRNDVQKAYSALNSSYPWFQEIDPVRQGVLINMTFNLGFVRFSGFHNFIEAVQEENWDKASVDMLDSLWAKQVGGRALRLAEQIRTGRWI